MEFTRAELTFLDKFARSENLSLHDLNEKFARAPTTTRYGRNRCHGPLEIFEDGVFGTTPRKGLFEVSLVFAMNLFNLLIKFEKIGVSVL